MKKRVWTFGALGLLLGVLYLAVPVRAIFAQEEGSGAAAGLALAGAFMLVLLVFVAALYVYIALALSTIAKKTNTENAWLAWIPIANIVLMLNIAKKPIWWIIFFVVPILNIAGIVFAILIWMAIAEARGKPNWWGILIIVPFVNLIVPGYLAWAD
jgi:hypothetical protein